MLAATARESAIAFTQVSVAFVKGVWFSQPAWALESVIFTLCGEGFTADPDPPHVSLCNLAPTTFLTLNVVLPRYCSLLAEAGP